MRLDVAGYDHANTTTVCTEHEKFVFPGLASLGARTGGKFSLSWPEVPDTEVVYSVYTRDAAANEGSSLDLVKLHAAN